MDKSEDWKVNDIIIILLTIFIINTVIILNKTRMKNFIQLSTAFHTWKAMGLDLLIYHWRIFLPGHQHCWTNTTYFNRPEQGSKEKNIIMFLITAISYFLPWKHIENENENWKGWLQLAWHVSSRRPPVVDGRPVYIFFFPSVIYIPNKHMCSHMGFYAPCMHTVDKTFKLDHWCRCVISL